MGFDLNLDDNHDIELDGIDLALTDKKNQTLQEIKIRLQLWASEWFLDVRAGIPYLEQVFKKEVSPETISAIFRKEILRAEGVIELLEFSMDYSNDRTLRLDFKVSTTEGIISTKQEITI